MDKDFEENVAKMFPTRDELWFDNGKISAIAGLDFDAWVRLGYERGWVSPPVCETHDGLPLSEAEAEDMEPCIHIMRLYESAEHKAAVESEHSPSVWRATNQGWGK